METRRNFLYYLTTPLLVLTLSRCSRDSNVNPAAPTPTIPTPAPPGTIVWNPFNPQLVDQTRIGERFVAHNDQTATDIFGVLRKNKIEPTSVFATYTDVDDGNREKRSWIVTALNGQSPPLGWVIIINGFHYFVHPSQDPWTAIKIQPFAKVEIYFAKLWDKISV